MRNGLQVLDGKGSLGGRLQPFADRVAEIGEALPEGFGEPGDEDDGVLIEDVQLVPDRLQTQALDGGRVDSRLAIAGGRADQRQPVAGGAFEVGERFGAKDDAVRAWAGEFRRDGAWIWRPCIQPV